MVCHWDTGLEQIEVTDLEVERIVQEVIRRLLSLGAEVHSSRQASVQPPLKLEEKVISMETIHGRLKGINQLIVKKKAVVTPSVRDELRQKKIELVREQ